MALYKTVIAWDDAPECDVKNCVLIGLKILYALETYRDFNSTLQCFVPLSRASRNPLNGL